MAHLSDQVILDMRRMTRHRPPGHITQENYRSSSSWLSISNRRQQALTNLQLLCQEGSICSTEPAPAGVPHQSLTKYTSSRFCRHFSREDVLIWIFQLFDYHSEGKLTPSTLIEFLKGTLGARGREFIDLFDTLVYVIANERDLDFQLFCRIFVSKGFLEKMFCLIDKDKTGSVSVEAVMDFIAEITLQRRQDVANLENVEEIFSRFVKEGTRELNLTDFKKIIPCKNPFFVERAFRVFDRDGSNTISTVEFRESLEQFCSQSVDDKVRFLFQIYDQDGDGLIQPHELKAVLAACSEENGMKFSEEQLNELTGALYEDASADNGTDHQDMGIGFDELKAQMAKQPGLLDNLSISLERFLISSSTARPGASPTRSKFSLAHLRNNASFSSFMMAYMAVNIILFITRAIQFRDSSLVYIFARAGGQALNFNCAFVVVLMLRHCITWLRMRGLANYLPLDQHVYLHKVCGFIIGFFSILHTVMHLVNFPMNIADKLVSPVTNQTHTAAEWLFTMRPGLFGLIPGIANITGWILLVIFAIMAVFSLPFVRKGGSFEVFYWTHLLYFPFWILLILHGPRFWYWFIVPGFLYIVVEKIVTLRRRWSGKGKTYISSAILLPSRVTHLVIKKPPNFHYHPGDYVFVQIPSLASYEWHPFTISSAPELPDFIWLHIRGAGGWTNNLYDYFEKQKAKICIKHSTGKSECQHCSDILLGSKGNRLASKSSANLQLHGLKSNSSQEPKALVEKRAACRLDSKISYPSADEGNLSSSRPADKNQQKQALSPRLTVPESRTGVRGTFYRYTRHLPGVISITAPSKDPSEGKDPDMGEAMRRIQSTPRLTYAPETMGLSDTLHVEDSTANHSHRPATEKSSSTTESDISMENIKIEQPLEIIVDGPYGAPSSHIFRAEHAVLIAAGIGVTPFASILKSIMNRYYAVRQTCPSCQHSWAAQMPDSIMNLKKVDFFWINREQRSFEWFVSLLSQLEMEQAEMGGALERFLDLHMYITSALKKTDMKAVGLQMALDLLHAKEKRDLVTGLKTRTNAGRPNWSKVFQKIVDEKKGKVTVFYCGPPQLAKELKEKCDAFGFRFRKEIF